MKLQNVELMDPEEMCEIHFQMAKKFNPRFIFVSFEES